MKGWDYFTPSPGKFPDVQRCRVCNEVMLVERNKTGPRGWAESMGGAKVLHDQFQCPNVEDAWHHQALRLRMLAEDTPSRIFADQLSAEADEICKTRKATK